MASPLAAQQPDTKQPDTKQPAAADQQPNAARRAADAKLRQQMAIDKPLMTLKEDEAKRKRILLRIRKVLRDGQLNDQTRAAIDEWIAWRLERMTITEIPKPPKKEAPARRAPMDPMDPMAAENPGPAAAPKEPLPPLPYRRRLAEFNRDFLQEIRGAAKFQTAPAKAEAFRRYILDEIIKKSRELFDNNFYVRLNVVMLLERLNLVEGSFRGVGQVAYAPVSAPLLEILRDSDQHEAVKIRAVAGLKRILEMGRPQQELTNEIALELIAQLEQDASMYWYPMRLVDALGSVDEPLITKVAADANGVPVQQPFHVQALTLVMRDPTHHWIVRSRAANSLGRVSLDASVNTSLLAHEIVVMCSQMSTAYNKQLDQFYWNQCFIDVYLAFKPIDDDEKARIYRVKPATLITKFDGQKAISDAYQLILPAVKHVLNQPQSVNNDRGNQPIPADVDQAMTTWISENKPSINKIAPGLPALVNPKPTAAKIDVPTLLPAAIVRDN